MSDKPPIEYGEWVRGNTGQLGRMVTDWFPSVIGEWLPVGNWEPHPDEVTGTRYVLLPETFIPSRSWAYGGLEALVDVSPYLAEGPVIRWCVFTRLAPGTASVYPVKGMVPGRGEGQWKFDEVQGWRYRRDVLEALVTAGPYVDLPPGIDADWLRGVLAKEARA